MKILVVSGFLGAGKTTFIRELLRRTGIRAVVLENEYGETDLDSRSIRGAGGTEVLEFMEGCVCCTRKDSFANTVITISAGMDPDFLIVEPSGVGKLGNIVENIRRVSYDRIRLLPPVLILAPRSIQAHLAEYPDIFTDQLSHAGSILFSKCEREDRGILDQAKELVSRYNSTAPVLETPYSSQDDAWWRELLTGTDHAEEHGYAEERGCHTSHGGDHSCHEEQEEAEGETPVHLTLHRGSLDSIGSLVMLLEEILRGKFGGIVRAKGVLCAGGERLRFDVADGLYAITGEGDAGSGTQMVFIGRDIDENAVRAKFGL